MSLLFSSGANGSPWWISAIEAFIIINLVLVCFAYLTLAERKVMGRMQLRYGPNRAGPYGLLQPIADLVKLIRKESFFPAAAIDVLYIFAPFLAAFTALCTFSVIPFGPGWEVGGYQINGYVADLPIALLLIFAIGSLGIYGFILGGWASDSKFALLGSMRTCAQLVSYEVSLALSVLGVILMARSLSLVDIVQAQADSTWYVAPQFVGFVIFLMAGKDYLILAKSETPINPNPPGKRRVHYAFAVHPGEAYDNAKAFLQKNGVAILDEELRSTGVFPGRQFYIEDPDRNVIEFSEFDGKEYE